MHDDLETLLKHHYREKGLSSEQLERIKIATRHQRRRSGRYFLPWLAAVVLAVALIIPALTMTSPDTHIETLFADISKNHLSNKPADFYASDLDALSDLFKKSGLNMRVPELINVHGQITGARLCSLAGQPAIHVYFSGNENERKSLFIAKAKGALKGVSTPVIEDSAMAILTWAENGHFYALAKDFK